MFVCFGGLVGVVLCVREVAYFLFGHMPVYLNLQYPQAMSRKFILSHFILNLLYTATITVLITTVVNYNDVLTNS